MSSLGSYVRSASHAGSWYEGDPAKLKRAVDALLNVEPPSSYSPCTSRILGIIGPHAGLRYCGGTSAIAYSLLRRYLYSSSAAPAKRFFLLGPSHCKYIEGIELSGASTVNTPYGSLPVDVDAMAIIRARCTALGLPCGVMTQSADEDEHSLEMHLPFLSHVLHFSPSVNSPSLVSQGASLVPIVVGDLSDRMQKQLADVLSPYTSSRDCVFIVSSDFCHWGSRFRFTHHFRPQEYPAIGDAIVAMDKEGMRLIESGNLAEWQTYLASTKNTICGRNPISVAMLSCEKEKSRIQFVGYSQSNTCATVNDSSVSYASAVIGS